VVTLTAWSDDPALVAELRRQVMAALSDQLAAFDRL
jgi:hypothetical protein